MNSVTNAGNLAAYIERYLEADDSGNGDSNGSSLSTASLDSATRQQLQALAQKTDQLRRDMASIKNNLQMSALLPMLIDQKLTVAAKSTGGRLHENDEIDFKQTDPLSALLPLLMMGGFGDSGSGGTDSSSNMLLLVLAISGKL